MKSLVAGVLILIVALASVLSCCHAERLAEDGGEYYDLMEWLSAVKRGTKRGLGRCSVNGRGAHMCKRGYSCDTFSGAPCSRDAKACFCRLHDDISWLL